MSERQDVIIRVISQKGKCDANHKVGEEWYVDDKTPKGMCIAAFDVIYPYLKALSFGGSFPWASDADTAVVACPDPENPVVFEIKRVKK